MNFLTPNGVYGELNGVMPVVHDGVEAVVSTCDGLDSIKFSLKSTNRRKFYSFRRQHPIPIFRI